MKLKILIGILVFLILVNVATIGTYLYLRFARGGGGETTEQRMDPGMGRGGPLEGLTEEQRRQFHSLMQEFHEGTKELRERVRTLERETFTLLQQDPIPQGEVDVKLNEMSQARLDISRKATETLVKAKSFLSAGQLERFYGAITQARPPFPPDGRRGEGGPMMRRFRDRGPDEPGRPPFEDDERPPPPEEDGRE